MKSTIGLLLACLFSITAVAQQPYGYQYKHQIDSVLVNDKSPVRFQLGAFYYSMIGEFKLDLSTLDHFRTVNDRAPLSPSKKADFVTYKPQQAVPYIIEQAKKTSVVIINEAHNQPRHRVFAASLLPHLKKLGYTIIGFEALAYDDKALNKRRYPLQEVWSYINEPAFGMLIRQALKLNYTAFSYEADDAADNKEREIQQASNIVKVMKQHPRAKFIIYCGYDHALEDSVKNWGLAMAGRLKRLTGVNPLTIDQAQLAETSRSDFDSPYRRLTDLSYSAVFINTAGKVFNTVNDVEGFDMNIYHPATRYIKGRPHWLKKADNRYVYIAGTISIKFPCLVFAYDVNETVDKAVPLDVIQLDSKADTKHLILPKGKKVIKVINAAGQKQFLTVN
ncbi:MAG: hypothetical protein V4619_15585 [Bacteroidota bacterium]